MVGDEVHQERYPVGDVSIAGQYGIDTQGLGFIFAQDGDDAALVQIGFGHEFGWACDAQTLAGRMQQGFTAVGGHSRPDVHMDRLILGPKSPRR